MPISRSDEKILWGRSGGRCACPGCRKVLAFAGEAGIIGIMAHIVAGSEDGPRGKSDLSREERDSYQNHVLLCPDHHALIDNDTTTWTVQRLQSIKKALEDWVESQLSKGSIWRANLATIHYLNVPRILFDLAARGELVDLAGTGAIKLDELQGLRGLGLQLAVLLSAFERLFHDWRPEALDLTKSTSIGSENLGARVRFTTAFRTKNVPSPGEAASEAFSLRGIIEEDPHLYCKVDDRKVYLALDPRWITTNTAFADFRPAGGSTKLAGLGVLKYVDERVAIVAPLVIGVPRPESEVPSWL